jgi:hypothetical protein
MVEDEEAGAVLRRLGRPEGGEAGDYSELYSPRADGTARVRLRLRVAYLLRGPAGALAERARTRGAEAARAAKGARAR